MVRFVPSAGLVLIAAVSLADDLQPLGDEFDDASSIGRWQDLGQVEGWQTPSVESADIDTTTPGHFRIVPASLTWFANLRGCLFFKEVNGDFVATMRMRVLSRHNPADPTEVPNRAFSLSGIFAHAPRPGTVHAAPDPYTTSAVWPPAANGSDWIPFTENYIFLSFGSAGNPGVRQFEIKATRNSDSRLYYDTTGISQTENDAWLQMVRIGDIVVCLRKHATGDPWIVENRYPNANHPFPVFGPDLQLGITAYTDWNNAAPFNAGGAQTSWHYNYAPPAGQPDLISEVDYFRIQRPDPALTEAALQAMTVSYAPNTSSTAAIPVTLADSPAVEPYLGDSANTPVSRLLVASVAASEASGQAVVTLVRTGSSSGAVTCDFQTATGSAGTGDYSSEVGSVQWSDGEGGEKAIVLPVAWDNEAEGNESFAVLLSGIDGPANFAGGEISHAVSVTIADHPLDQWRLEAFGAEANSAIGQLDADYDGDSLANLLEYVVGSDPEDPHSAPKPSVTLSGNQIALSFTPASETSIPELVAEASSDLSPTGWWPLATRPSGSTQWQTDSVDTSVDIAPDGTVTVTDATTAVRRFVRLTARVLSPP